MPGDLDKKRANENYNTKPKHAAVTGTFKAIRAENDPAQITNSEISTCGGNGYLRPPRLNTSIIYQNCRMPCVRLSACCGHLHRGCILAILALARAVFYTTDMRESPCPRPELVLHLLSNQVGAVFNQECA
jgi:hypothetical protein